MGVDSVNATRPACGHACSSSYQQEVSIMQRIQSDPQGRRVCGNSAIRINSKGMRINPALPRGDDIQLAVLQHREQQLKPQRQTSEPQAEQLRPEALHQDHACLRRRIAEQIRAALNSEAKAATTTPHQTKQTTPTPHATESTHTSFGGQIHA